MEMIQVSHLILSVRIAQRLDIARSKGLTKENCKSFLTTWTNYTLLIIMLRLHLEFK